MKHTWLVILCIILSSCSFFDVKKTSSEAILTEELETFNWSEVDEYPTFSTCDSNLTSSFKKECFVNKLNHYVTKRFQKENIVFNDSFNETVELRLHISNTGKLTVKSIEIDSFSLEKIPNLDQVLETSFDSIPAILPAIKRGQQVNVEFKLPVIIMSF